MLRYPEINGNAAFFVKLRKSSKKRVKSPYYAIDIIGFWSDIIRSYGENSIFTNFSVKVFFNKIYKGKC